MTKEEVVASSLEMAVREAFDTPELMREYDRLYGTTFTTPRSLAGQIDRATGKHDEDMKAFVGWVRRCVWQPWVSSMASEVKP